MGHIPKALLLRAALGSSGSMGVLSRTGIDSGVGADEESQTDPMQATPSGALLEKKETQQVRMQP
jgi:P pilus assembly chaperone PapD